MKKLLFCLLLLNACGPSKEVVQVVNGTNGTNGANGENGADGSSCMVTPLLEGDVTVGGLISCTDGTSAVILNGEQGLQGPDGLIGATGPAGATGPMGPTGPAGQNAISQAGCTLVFVSQDKYRLTCGSTSILINSVANNGNGH